MTNSIFKDGFAWGFALWLVGYILGFIFFAFVPPSQIGWYIMPIGIIITVWVAMRKIRGTSLRHYINAGVVWMLIAIVCDYLFLFLLLKPADGYYKLDVYAYYALTFVLPVMAGLVKRNKLEKAAS